MYFPIEELNKRATPCYFYDMRLLRQTLQRARECAGAYGYCVHYAVKANANPVVLQTIANAGLGADCVSGWEVKAALEAGFAPQQIVFAGVGKTDSEILCALEAGISCFNVESAEELEVIDALAGDRKQCANVALRVNPDIDAHTHKYITTGLSENKFGIAIPLLDDAVELALKLRNVKLVGLHLHIGSQLTDMEPYAMLCDKINELQRHYAAKGITFATINAGGGLGIDYARPDEAPIADFEAFFDVFKRRLQLRQGQTLHFELGRSIVGQCGTLVSRVTLVKRGLNKEFVILDAGMNNLIRPALYQARHLVQNITNTDCPTLKKYDVVGPVCESSDCFAEDVRLPQTRRGDLMAIRSAGAYGESMASHYNCRPLASVLTL